MSIENRLLDDSAFTTNHPDAPQPQFVEILLTELGVDDEPHDKKVAALRSWLRANRPSHKLLRSFKRDGYSDALDTSSRATA